MRACVQVVTFLVEEGAPLEAVDEIKWSALHHAAGNGYANVIRYLVQEGKKKKTATWPRHHCPQCVAAAD